MANQPLMIWMDGKLCEYSQAHVHVLSHSLHYGSAAFEGVRAYKSAKGETAIFRAREHFDRLMDSAKIFDFKINYSVDDLIAATKVCIKANKYSECYIRPLIYLDDSIRGLKLPDDPKAHVAIACWDWGKYLGDEGIKNGIRVMISSLRRADVASSMPFAKVAGNYITSILARREATKSKFDEAILLDPQGFIGEGTGENIFMYSGGKLVTPPTRFILPGITRDAVIKIARDHGIDVEERPITRNEIYLADEVFFTGTAAEVTPVREIDHYTIGEGRPGPVTKKLFDLFFKCVQGELPRYSEWLTKV
jgi:branched-chain amino acid aminotransferase